MRKHNLREIERANRAGRKPPRPGSEGDVAVGTATQVLALVAAVRAADNLRAWVHAIGNAEAWRGTMGDDGQGHDEAVARATMMLREFDDAFARFTDEEPTP